MYDEKIRKLLGPGLGTVSGVAGAGLGLLFPTTAGTLAGAALPPLMQSMLENVFGDMADRQLSDRERSKVGKAARHALDRILERLVAGEQPRQDRFFEPLADDRSPAETVFEGVLMKCRHQWEEKKIPWIANILVNAAFSDVPPEVVNRTIDLTDRLTWRQFCVTALAGKREEMDFYNQWNPPPPMEMSKTQTVFVGEVEELFDRQYGFLTANPIDLAVMGQISFDLMSFEDFPKVELEFIAQWFPRPRGPSA